jgi:hypothetical protein
MSTLHLRLRGYMARALPLLVAVVAVGCGGASGIGAVNTMPRHASSKAMDKAEACDDGDLRSCNWLGIWYLVGGAGKDRSYEGRRFLRHACREGYSPSCKLMAVLNKPKPNQTVQASPPPQPSPAPPPAPARPASPPASQPSAAAPSSFADLVGGGGSAPSGAGPCEAKVPGGASDAVRAQARQCDGGAMQACHEMGMWFFKGEGGKELRLEGVRWFKHACDRGYQPSCQAIELIKRKLQELKEQKAREQGGM